MTSQLEPAFSVGDFVIKDSGDYTFKGVVVSAYRKAVFEKVGISFTGPWRYDVQNRDGVLHIFSAKQLRKINT